MKALRIFVSSLQNSAAILPAAGEAADSSLYGEADFIKAAVSSPSCL